MTNSVSKNCLRFLGLAVVGLWAHSAQAETTLTYADQNNNAAQAVVIQVQPPYLRMDEAGGMWMLYDSKTDVLYAVNPADSSYTQMDRSMAKQLGGVMDMVQEQMKGLPPEQRAAIEQMMGRPMKPSPKKSLDYTMTKTTRKHAGVTCTVGHLVRDGKARHEFCVAEPQALGMPGEDYAVLTKMFELMSQFREAASGMMGEEMPDPTQMKGVAIESNGPKGGHQILSKVSHDKVSAELFKIPTNYRQEVIPNLTP